MNKFNESAFPVDCKFDCSCGREHGLTKLEYTAIKIFCSFGMLIKTGERLDGLRKLAIEQAKLLLQECEEASK